jgi:hypothetical protein
LALSAALWLQGVRQKNFNKVKEQIESNLFLAKPTFAPHLREICEWAVWDTYQVTMSFCGNSAM